MSLLPITAAYNDFSLLIKYTLSPAFNLTKEFISLNPALSRIITASLIT